MVGSIVRRLRNIRLDRGVGSYAAVRDLVSPLIRNKAFQLDSRRIRGLRYLDIGTGPNTHEDFVNVDFQWTPAIDLCWDITRGLPFPDGAMDGIFSEHCLEHLPQAKGLELLKECRRVLSTQGTLRVVVPDAGLYLARYADPSSGAFPYGATAGGITSPLIAVNAAFYQDRESSFGHVWMYDFDLLEKTLKAAGFETVVLADFRSGRDPKLLVDSEHRRCESLYVEAFG